jgi:hypothetical protein
MPFGDGTGPRGEGPFTGRRGGGMGRGRGLGRGLGRGIGRGLGRGIGYGRSVGRGGVFLAEPSVQETGEKIDEKTQKLANEIYNVLPKINCGACGYPTCMGCAVAIAQGKAPYNACRVLRPDGHQKIKEILDKEGR